MPPDAARGARGRLHRRRPGREVELPPGRGWRRRETGGSTARILLNTVGAAWRFIQCHFLKCLCLVAVEIGGFSGRKLECEPGTQPGVDDPRDTFRPFDGVVREVVEEPRAFGQLVREVDDEDVSRASNAADDVVIELEGSPINRSRLPPRLRPPPSPNDPRPPGRPR